MYDAANNFTAGIRPDASARNMLDQLGISDYLNRDGVTEVLINRPGEVFLETAKGFERFEDARLHLRALRRLPELRTKDPATALHRPAEN